MNMWQDVELSFLAHETKSPKVLDTRIFVSGRPHTQDEIGKYLSGRITTKLLYCLVLSAFSLRLRFLSAS